MKKIVLAVILLVAIVVFLQSAYKVDQTEVVIVTQFGEIQETQTTPGLKFKAPFIQSITRLDRRVLRVDVQPSAFPDVDAQFLDIDAYVRYRIRPDDGNIRSFRRALISEAGATDPISQIVIAALRDEVGRRLREEIIGGDITVNEDGTRTVTARATDGVPVREQLTRIASASVQARADEQIWGIEIIDVRIKRADFPDSIVESIYNRMRSEREVQAQRLRAEGEEAFLTKTADVSRRVQVIGAEADEQSSRTRGEGEAQAIKILADALGKDPELFAFRRSLQAYAEILSGNTTLVLPADSSLFQYLQNPDGINGQ